MSVRTGPCGVPDNRHPYRGPFDFPIQRYPPHPRHAIIPSVPADVAAGRIDDHKG
jgi:hypothetical protein